jgi:hypothetical protein
VRKLQLEIGIGYEIYWKPDTDLSSMLVFHA